MHQAAFDWVTSSFHKLRNERGDLRILEIGSLDINGGVRNYLLPYSSSYHGIDPQDGPGVDEVADASEFIRPRSFDCIISTEVFEHTPSWRQIIGNSHINLVDGGFFIATMAGETRPPHSAVHGNAGPYEWEHYANIGEWELGQTLKKYFSRYETSYINPMVHGDLRCWAIK